MFDWIPLEIYADIYHYSIAIILIIAIMYLLKFKITDYQNLNTIQTLTIILLLIGVIYVGLRPVSGRYFGDMSTYNRKFLEIQELGITALPNKDKFFYYFMYLCTKVMNNQSYFVLMNFLYLFPMYIVSKANFKKGAFYMLLMLMASFSFFSAGVNGIRNGLATSIFLLLFLNKKMWIQVSILILAYSIHSSMIVPILSYIIVYFYRKPKHIIYGWMACIPISLVFGDQLQSLFANLIDDERVSYLTEGNIGNDQFSSTGFRWDFLVYSATAVFAGWYYIFRKGFQDNMYTLIYGTYVIANGFWILVIKANFSNRFAYLSWFMMALVIFYPVIKSYLFKNHNQVLIYLMLAYFGFTFFMNVIIY